MWIWNKWVLITALLITVLLLLNYIFKDITTDKEKHSPYECGFIPVTSQNRYRFEIIYYLIALLFLGFDLEIGLLIPMLTISSSYWISLTFVTILTVSFIYEFKMKALNIKDV